MQKKKMKKLITKRKELGLVTRPCTSMYRGGLKMGRRKENKSAHDRLTTGIRIAAMRAARGSVRLGHFVPTAHSTHSLPALVFASQSPYPGWQTVVYLER